MEFTDDMDESVKKFNWIVSVPIGLPICVMGIIGNVLSIIVWNGLSSRKRSGSSSASTYLITLGVCDIGFLVFYILAEVLPNGALELKSNYTYAVIYSWVAYPTINFFFVSGVWLVVGVTTNRFILTYFPLKGKGFCTKVRTRMGIAAILILAVCVNIPHFWNYHPAEVEPGVYKLKKTKYGASFHAKMFHFWLHCIALSITPWFLIATMNCMIIRKLKKQTVKFTSIRSRTKSQDQDRRITSMLLGITFSFLILLGLQCVTQCLHKQEYRINDKVFWTKVLKAFTVGRLALVINSSINCLFYCFSGMIFRAEAKRIFSRRRISSASSTFTSRMSTTLRDGRNTIQKITSIMKGGNMDKDTTPEDSKMYIIPNSDADNVSEKSENEITTTSISTM